MRADIHGGPEQKLQSEAGYIDARPLTASSAKPLATHGRTIHSGQNAKNSLRANVFCSSANSGHSWAVTLRAHRESVTLAHPTQIRTEAGFDFKLCLWRFTFLNRTKPTKYEALEKNAVSRPIVPKIGNLRYSRDPRKPHFCSGIFGLFADAEA